MMKYVLTNKRAILFSFAIGLLLSMHNSLAISADSIGMVDMIQGEVYAISTSGEKRRLSGNAPIYEGDFVETEKGAVVLVMADGTQFTIYDESRMKMKVYQFHKQGHPDDRAEYAIFVGNVEFFSGDMGQRGNEVSFFTAYQVIKPISTVVNSHIRFLTLSNGTVVGLVKKGTAKVERNTDGTRLVKSGLFFMVEQNDNKYITTVVPYHKELILQINSRKLRLPSDITGQPITGQLVVNILLGTEIAGKNQQLPVREWDDNTDITIGGSITATPASPH
jgi:hypothetical protein